MAKTVRTVFIFYDFKITYCSIIFYESKSLSTLILPDFPFLCLLSTHKKKNTNSVGNEDCWKSAFITSLDTILFTVTLVICLSIYIAVTARVLQGKDFMGHPSDTY
jgi:hypothetical protein